MAWSYGADPAGSVIDEVHFLVGDTDSTDPLLQDEEVSMLLTRYPKPDGKPAYLAGAAAAEAIAAKFARKMNSTVGPLSQQAEQQYLHYLQMADKLRAAWATNGRGSGTQTLRITPGIPVLGGGGDTVLGTNTLPVGGAQ
jgi:hypothetical protein